MKMNSNRHLIVMTATVEPQVDNGLVRNQFGIRLNDYLEAISKTFEQIEKSNLKVHIIVVENSGNMQAILDKIGPEILNSDLISFITCPIDTDSKAQGISAGEHQMLKLVSKQYELRQFDYIWKLTGRIYLRNLHKILQKQANDISINSFFTQHHSCDSKFFGMKKDLFIHFSSQVPIYAHADSLGKKMRNNEKFISIEYSLARFALEMESQGFSYGSLPLIPEYVGYSASTDKALNTIRTKVVIRISNLIRKVVVKGLIGINP